VFTLLWQRTLKMKHQDKESAVINSPITLNLKEVAGRA